jgi:guanylate kinase
MSSEAGTARGGLFVVSAPSGTGKTTVVERLVELCPNLYRSRSYTSRPARPGEADGVDYNFISRSAFEAMVRGNEFLEWADVFGNLYGTAQRDTEAALATGRDVLLVIDVQGARQVRERIRDAVGVFVLPPSFDQLEARLRGRCKDEPAVIARRLETARSEVSAVAAYEYVVVNDDLERCVGELAAIITAERARRSRRQREVDAIARTFERRNDP